jgi:hypothetical protein
VKIAPDCFCNLTAFSRRKKFVFPCCKFSNIVSFGDVFPERGFVMQIMKGLTLGLLIVLVAPNGLLAQAIGEYGRTVGGVGQRQGKVSQKASRTSSQNSKGKGVVEGVGDLGGRPVPSAIVVASRQAALYPRQDDESEKIAELSQGDTLVPMGQSNEWYMVKTQKGLVGWIKSADVRTEAEKK